MTLSDFAVKRPDSAANIINIINAGLLQRTFPQPKRYD
jgi:hypothetical protein